MKKIKENQLAKGIELHSSGKFELAQKCYEAVLELDPNHPDANHNMGVLKLNTGDNLEALLCFQKALQEDQSIARFWLSYTKALIMLDRKDEAEGVLDQAFNFGFEESEFCELKHLLNSSKKTPNSYRGKELSQEAIKQLLYLYANGKLEETIAEAINLIGRFPTAFMIWNILGAANSGLGKQDEALTAFKKVTELNPNYPDGYNNLGVTLIEQNKPDEAIAAYSKALALKTNYAEAYNNLGHALKGRVFEQANPDLQKTINSLLEQKNSVRPKDIAPAVISLLEFEPILMKLLKNPSDYVSKVTLEGDISDLSKIPLLLKLISDCPIPNLGLESLFKKLRAAILNNLSALSPTPELFKFQSALALHCFTNEYIYDVTSEETETFEALEALVLESFRNNQQPNPESILCLASYKALHNYLWCDRLSVTDEIDEVFTRQVSEIHEEIQLRSGLSSLTPISNDTSLVVAQQYEVNPYPRWTNLALPAEPQPIANIVEQLKIKLFDTKICETQAPNILVAGCGTGQHSIGTAATVKNSKILAIDLSLTSLAYAKRRTLDLNIKNIEYMQADILELNKIGREFDVIESSGVLHHLSDPLTGWQVLVDLLKDGGLMKIGLYSDLARQHIVKIRDEISQLRLGASDLEMKSFRSFLTKSNQDHHKRIINSDDFYSLSGMRDLLFHVQEHRFTIPQLKECLAQLGLKFCGFEDISIVQRFKLSDDQSKDPYDLNDWHKYEKAYPLTFAGMYQFWCQKCPP